MTPGALASGAAAGKASLEGTVVKCQTGEPVKKALIELVAEGSDDPKVFTATTNPEGEFTLEGLPAGHYRVFAERTGFIEVDKKGRQTGETAISLDAGQQLKDFVLYMLPAAIITGRVIDEDGDPMADVDMVAWRPTFSPAGERWESAATQRTNDLGEYRIPGLFPGKYLISATPGPGIENFATPLKDPSGPPKPDSAYITTYYPNEIERTQAPPVSVHAGDNLTLDFSLSRISTATIRGTVTNLAPGAKAFVSLHMSEGEQYLTQIEADKNGRFEVRKVPPGFYTLLATVNNGELMQVAHQTVSVTGTNLDGVRLIPLPGATLQGRVRFEGDKALDPSKFLLDLHSTDGDDEPLAATRFIGDNNRVTADGSFAWKNVPAGTYYLQVSGDGTPAGECFLKAVTAGGQSVLENGITVSGGSLWIDVALSTKAAAIDGDVVNTKHEPVANALIAAVPEERYRKRQDRYLQARADQRGHFRLQGISPGNYMVFAFDDLDGSQFYDPEFLKSHETAGKTFRATEGARENLTLTVVPPADDSQTDGQP
jgi:protocatechuate 3,4-dioxygenase beta subunit